MFHENWQQAELALLGSRELFPLGTHASVVFCGIVRRFPVERYAVTDYDPYGTYKFDPGQGICWREGVPTEERLFEESERIHRKEGRVYSFEGITIDLRKVMGVCSVVEINGGQKYHLPMLDFCVEVGPESLATIRESLRLPTGVFLKTGNSYHYYGNQLMPEEEWRGWMGGILGKKNLLDIIVDEDYLQHSLERGWAALRIYGYPGTGKGIIPEVVGYTYPRGVHPARV